MSIDSTLLPLPLRNIPAKAHKRCVVWTTWESSTDFSPALERGERRRNPSPGWRKDASLGRYGGCGCPTSCPEGPARRGTGAGSPRPALAGLGGDRSAAAARTPAPQPRSSAALRSPLRSSAAQPHSSARSSAPQPRSSAPLLGFAPQPCSCRGRRCGKSPNAAGSWYRRRKKEVSFQHAWASAAWTRGEGSQDSCALPSVGRRRGAAD